MPSWMTADEANAWRTETSVRVLLAMIEAHKPAGKKTMEAMVRAAAYAADILDAELEKVEGMPEEGKPEENSDERTVVDDGQPVTEADSTA